MLSPLDSFHAPSTCYLYINKWEKEVKEERTNLIRSCGSAPKKAFREVSKRETNEQIE